MADDVIHDLKFYAMVYERVKQLLEKLHKNKYRLRGNSRCPLIHTGVSNPDWHRDVLERV